MSSSSLSETAGMPTRYVDEPDANLILRATNVADELARDAAEHGGMIGFEYGRDALAIREVCRRLAASRSEAEDLTEEVGVEAGLRGIAERERDDALEQLAASRSETTGTPTLEQSLADVLSAHTDYVRADSAEFGRRDEKMVEAHYSDYVDELADFTRRLTSEGANLARLRKWYDEQINMAFEARKYRELAEKLASELAASRSTLEQRVGELTLAGRLFVSASNPGPLGYYIVRALDADGNEHNLIAASVLRAVIDAVGEVESAARSETRTPTCGVEGCSNRDCPSCQRIAELEAQLAASRSEGQQDRERLDWLEREACKVEVVEIVDNVRGREGFSIYGMGAPDDPSTGATLRDAIDDGMKAEAEGIALFEKFKAQDAMRDAGVKSANAVEPSRGQRAESGGGSDADRNDEAARQKAAPASAAVAQPETET